MTWTKTPDDYPDKHLGLSDAAYRLHHAATTYCNRVGNDGFLERSRLGFVPVPGRTRRKAVVQELVEAGLWQSTESGWQLGDFLMHQPSAEEVRLNREYNRVRQAVRFAKGDENKAVLKTEEKSVLAALHAAREQRSALFRSANSSAIHNAPSSPVPLRPAPIRGRERDTRASADGLEATASLSDCAVCRKPCDGPAGPNWTVRADSQGRTYAFHDVCYGRRAG